MTAIATPSNSIITQVPGQSPGKAHQKTNLPEELLLDLRGTRITVARNILINLPDTLLIDMLPQGLNSDQNSVHHVDFDPNTLLCIIQSFTKAKELFQGKHSKLTEDVFLAHAVVSGIPLNPMITKQGIVVLREELAYFVMCKNRCDVQALRQKSLQLLEGQNTIFEALLSNGNNNESKEIKRLVDLLCQAGFDLKDTWQHRFKEPGKTIICSLSNIAIDYDNRLHVGRKFMPFWHKPYTKCWWNKSLTVGVDCDKEFKLWCRRTWTLELVLL